MERFSILPILGRKTDVAQNDFSLFRVMSERVVATHDVGGQDYNISSKPNTCIKADGYSQYDNTANAQATKILGLFELYDGTNRTQIVADNGKIYYLDASLDQTALVDAASTTFANDNIDLYTFIKIGSYMVFTDRGEHTPYKWKSGDANLTKLAASGTEYKFKWIESFQRRVIGVYCIDDTDAPDLSVRWSTPWPSTAITSLNFPAANQAYISNDDPLVGVKTMGLDRCFVYSKNSIHAIDYYADYSTPFRIRNVVSGQGAVNNHSIVDTGNGHYVFNEHYGFCGFDGNEFPAGGRPISADIETDLGEIDNAYHELIQGVFVPWRNEIIWTVPFRSSATPNMFFIYNINTGQWRLEEKAFRYVDLWKTGSGLTWNGLIALLGGTGATWEMAGSNSWAYYSAFKSRVVMGNTDGHVYLNQGSSADGADFEGYRIEPILDFGDPFARKILQEIWFEFTVVSTFSVDVYYRAGDTVGEVVGSAWTQLDSISSNAPTEPVTYVPDTSAKRLYQIKWGSDSMSEPFEVNRIDFVYTMEAKY